VDYAKEEILFEESKDESLHTVIFLTGFAVFLLL
jgi:hypothetical protein